MAVPESLRRNIVELHGRAGEEWLGRIPELLDVCVARWRLALGSVYSGGSYSYVVRVAREDGSAAVLKLSFPGEEVSREAHALHAFGGRGAVVLLAQDAALGALLLSCAEPGHPLAQRCETDDVRATSIAAEVIRTLDRPAPTATPFPSVRSWLPEIDRLRRRIELEPPLSALAADAHAVMTELTRTPAPQRLLHGDLHQFNILAAGSTWLAVDPKGIVGDPECEIAPLLLNPLTLLRGPGSSRLLRRRITQLCDELELDPRRAHGWTFVRAVLAISWALEDHGQAPAEWVACAQWLRHHTFTSTT